MATQLQTRSDDEASDEASDEPDGDFPFSIPYMPTQATQPSAASWLSILTIETRSVQGFSGAAPRSLALILVLVSHLCVTACIWLLPNPQLTTWSTRVLNTFAFLVALICLLVFEFTQRDSSQFTLQARVVMYLQWALTCTAMCCFLVPPVSLAFHVSYAFKTAVCTCLTWATQLAVQTRFELVEAASDLRLGSRYMCCTRALSLLSGCVVTVWWALVALGHIFGIPLPELTEVSYDLSDLGYNAACMIAWAAITAISSWGLKHACNLAYASAVDVLRKNSYMRAEWNWARKVLGRMRGATVLVCGAHAGVRAWLLAYRAMRIAGRRASWMESAQSWVISDLILTVSEFACFLVMVGFFRTHFPAYSRPALRHNLPPQAQSAGYVAKVRELAERSIDVSMLLDFFDMLGMTHGAMAHYDPWRSTTNDVVRCSVIPMSRTPRGGGSAYATRFAGSGREPMPCIMVTHTWSSLFIDLVAAVVADALGLDEYESIVEDLTESRTSDIKQRLAEKGSLSQTYWICCFCVNQHSSICGGFGAQPPADTAAYHRWKRHSHDSVSGRMLPCCPCNETKLLNDRPDECELNKFDDMMAFLQREVSGFRQLVVVDRHLEVFSRLWCVAELVQAYMSGIGQSLCMLSREVLNVDHEDFDIFWRLVTLDVAECNATREEDKAAILSKIPTEFNAQLQAAIFGEQGFLGKHFIGFDELRAASLSVHRLRTASQHSSSLTSSSSSSERSE